MYMEKGVTNPVVATGANAAVAGVKKVDVTPD